MKTNIKNCIRIEIHPDTETKALKFDFGGWNDLVNCLKKHPICLPFVELKSGKIIKNDKHIPDKVNSIKAVFKLNYG